MKKLLLALLILSTGVFSQDLHTRINTEVRSKVASQTRLAGILDIMTDSLRQRGGTAVFENDIIVSLSGGKTLGPYSNGQTIPTRGKTFEQGFNLIAREYQTPTWNYFTQSGYVVNLEVNSTISGSKTFLWSINANSGTVSTIDITDLTAGTTLATNTPNDGTQAVTVTTITLSTDGASQSWQGVLHDTGTEPSDVNSSVLTVIGRFKRFYGPVSTTVTNSATTRALTYNDFQQSGTNIFIFNSGTSLKEFDVVLPTGKSITNVVDLDAFGADLTSAFVSSGTVSVNDAGGVPHTSPLYKYVASSTYFTNHRFQITTN
jgi:hypothetical protein